MGTAVGRHLWAGALANTALAVVLSGVAFFALRRGERRAVWHVSSENLAAWGIWRDRE